ncbi:MAG: glycosyltransferase [Candidatus Theseobacter exili]|nr:glycosyltransferase [Candidatus Theseobacter exili]
MSEIYSLLKIFIKNSVYQYRTSLKKGYEALQIDKASLLDTDYYLASNQDVADSNKDPLTHFVWFGASEGRSPHQYFDVKYYTFHNPDVKKFRINPVLHFLKHGCLEGRRPVAWFDPLAYLEDNPDVSAMKINPLVHFIKYGVNENRTCSYVPVFRSKYNLPDEVDKYESWLCVNSENKHYQNVLLDYFGFMNILPKISVVFPVFNAPVDLLSQAVNSVKEQIYTNWELCIADDCSDSADLKLFYQEMISEKDDKIKICFRNNNGHISRATNSAAEMATGEFLLFLDQDDLLVSEALAEIAVYINKHPDTDMLYSDSDKIDGEDNRYDPHFKPDWSPELLLSYMYVGQVLTVRRSVYSQLGGMRVGFEGSQDHDLALRVSEKSRHIGHIHKILYHWRCIPGSTAMSGHEKPYSFDAGCKAVQEALHRRGSKGVVFQPEWAVKNGTGIFEIRFPDEGPDVTIIIPTKNNGVMLAECLESLKKTTYKNCKVLIIDNESDDPETIELLHSSGHEILYISSPEGKFNFSYVNNRAAEHSKSNYICFLNNDIEVTTPEWLSKMIGYAQLEGVGAVGAQLRFPDGRVQHAGIVLGVQGRPGHAFRLLPMGDSGYLGLVEISRNCIGVTAACMVTDRRLFLETGGFDEERFAVAYNDPDYCCRLLDKGYRSVYSAGSKMIHYEGSSRGYSYNPTECIEVSKVYRNKIDPYLNLNLSRDNELFEITPRFIFSTPVKKSIKLLAFTHNLHYEGAPIWQFDLLQSLKRNNGIEPVISTLHDGPLRVKYESENIPVLINDFLSYYDIDSYLTAMGKIKDILSDYQIDIVHANTLESFYAVDAAALSEIPSVWNIHESEPWYDHHLFKNLPSDIEQRAFRCFTYPYNIIFVASTTRQRYEALNSANNFTVIHNGLQSETIKEGKKDWPREKAREKLGLNKEDISFLLLGTVCGRKGQLDLVRAIEQVDYECLKNCKFYIVGCRDNNYSKQVRSFVQGLPSDKINKINLVKETGDTALYYQSADVFVCTSRIESFSLVILEAMAYGLPIITTPVSGITGQVFNGYNAEFYNPGDIDKLFELIKKMHDKELRFEMGEKSKNVLESLITHDEMREDYFRIICEAYFSGKTGQEHSNVFQIK